PLALQQYRSRCQPQADGEQDCFRSKGPRESRGIRRRKHDNLEGIGTNRSEYAMSTASPMYGWNTIRWKAVERQVWQLQKRIYQASSRGDERTVRKLQRLLMKSRSAKFIAVRRVTQDNQGKRTAGIDGVKSLSRSERLALVDTLRVGNKAKPVRRV